MRANSTGQSHLMRIMQLTKPKGVQRRSSSEKNLICLMMCQYPTPKLLKNNNYKRKRTPNTHINQKKKKNKNKSK